MSRKRMLHKTPLWQTAISLLAASLMACVAYGDSSGAIYPTSRACVTGESWSFGSGEIPDEYQAEFNAFLNDSTNPQKAIRGFSEALALRRSAKTAIEKSFAEYWVSRALFGLRLPHLANIAFQSIAARDPAQDGPSGMPIHAAALDCLLRIHLQHPSIALPDSALTYLGAEFTSTGSKKEMRTMRPMSLDAAVAGVQALVSDDTVSPERVEAILDLMKGGGAYEDLARGIWSAKQGKHRDTVRFLSRFFSDSVPASLERYEDTAHLLSARARYTLGDFDAAENELKQVRKSSNALAESLQELSWADLMNERYPEAIGTAMNLDGGGLRHTYTPEAPMVSAMAMNELCQYPDAVREIAVFRRDYKQSYSWLSNWVGTQADRPEAVAQLYEQAVRFIQRKSDIPDRVAGEWVRTPLFIASQDEVNTLFDERDLLTKISGVAGREQRAMATQILKDARELKPKYRIARMKLKAGDHLPPSILNSLASLKQEVIHWHRFQHAAPVWIAISNRFRGTLAPSQDRLVSRINSSIKDLNLRMLTQLDEIAENIQLIEVEIYNGASQDIIWQNAHPDYRQIAKQMRDAREAVIRSKTWDWGRELASSDENSEIWEDELGSFKANLFDNCSSKDKYLAIRMKRRR